MRPNETSFPYPVLGDTNAIPDEVPEASVIENIPLKEQIAIPYRWTFNVAIKNQDINGVLSRLGNVLETVTVPAYPVINTLKEEMLRLGAEGTLMSGSGPTVFGIFRDLPSAESAYIQLKQEKLAKQIFVTTPVQTI